MRCAKSEDGTSEPTTYFSKTAQHPKVPFLPPWYPFSLLPYRPDFQLLRHAPGDPPQRYPVAPRHPIHDATADKYAEVFFRAEKAGKELQQHLDDIVLPANITQSLGAAIVRKVAAGIEKGTPTAMAFAESLQRATKEAKIFACEHPVLVTILAIGVLCLLAPVVLEWLGFSEIGPVAGEVALSI